MRSLNCKTHSVHCSWSDSGKVLAMPTFTELEFSKFFCALQCFTVSCAWLPRQSFGDQQLFLWLRVCIFASQSRDAGCQAEVCTDSSLSGFVHSSLPGRTMTGWCRRKHRRRERRGESERRLQKGRVGRKCRREDKMKMEKEK